MSNPINDDHLAGLPSLGRRLSRKIEKKSGLRLTPADLDLLVLSGAYEALCTAVSAYQKGQSARRASQAKLSAPTAAPTGHPQYEAAASAATAAALATARRLTAPRSKRQDAAYVARLTKDA